MHYSAYMKRTEQAAKVVGGRVVSLAGGFYGVELPADGIFILLALDLDGHTGWWAWTEDQHGERPCECQHELGWPAVAELASKACEAVIHRCPVPQ